MAFDLTGYYVVVLHMVGPSHTDNVDVSLSNLNALYAGSAASDFLSEQNDYDTLNIIGASIITALLANSPTRWTSGTVNSILKVPYTPTYETV